jgi:hypothetical protein
MCTILFQTILVYLNPLNGTLSAKLKSNGNKALPFFKPFLIGNIRQMLAYLASAVPFIQIHFY